MNSQSARSAKLADELFLLVQGDQGKAFISDGLDVLTPADIVEAARTSLRYTERVARKLRQWLARPEVQAGALTHGGD